MAKKKRIKGKTAKIKNPSKEAEALTRLQKIYSQQVNDETGFLHNKIVAFISEARLPLTHVITVLDMVREEAIELARQKYFKEK